MISLVFFNSSSYMTVSWAHLYPRLDLAPDANVNVLSNTVTKSNTIPTATALNLNAFRRACSPPCPTNFKPTPNPTAPTFGALIAHFPKLSVNLFPACEFGSNSWFLAAVVSINSVKLESVLSKTFSFKLFQFGNDDSSCHSIPDGCSNIEYTTGCHHCDATDDKAGWSTKCHWLQS